MTRTPMEMSCWRGKFRVKGAKIVLWKFIAQENSWLYRKRRPYLTAYQSGVYHRYTGYVWFSEVLDPNDWRPRPLASP